MIIISLLIIDISRYIVSVCLFNHCSLDTSVGGFIFEDQLLQISSSVPSKYLYGLGEHEHQSLLHQNWNWQRWGMFSRDEFPNVSYNLNL